MSKERIKNAVKEFTMWAIFISLFNVPWYVAWGNYSDKRDREELEYLIRILEEKRKTLPAPIEADPFYVDWTA